MIKYPMMSGAIKKISGVLKLHLILVLITIPIISCNDGNQKSPESEPGDGETSANPTPSPIEPVEGDKPHDLFLYRWGSGDLFQGGGGPGMLGEAELILFDVADERQISGFYIDAMTQVMISPDGAHFLTIQKHGDSPILTTELNIRETGEELWSIELPETDSKWAPKYNHAVWDLERDRVILEGTNIQTSGDVSDLTSRFMSVAWWFIVIDLETGEVLAKTDIIKGDKAKSSPFDTTAPPQYGGGKLYLQLPDYPITKFEAYGLDSGRNEFDIYEINPVTGEGRKLGIRESFVGKAKIGNYFVTEKGDKLFMLVEEDYDEDSRAYSQSTIYQVALPSVAFTRIVTSEEKELLLLKGITPDGSRLLYDRHRYANLTADEPPTLYFVRDLDDKYDHQLPVGTIAGFSFLWLSPSGEYVLSYNFGRKELELIDVDEGSKQTLVKPDSKSIPFPITFIGGLGSGL